jgi:hypothetical protein
MSKYVSKERLRGLLGENELKDKVLNDLIEHYNDNNGKDTYLWMSDILTHGCVSGMIGDLVYYTDTTAFYEKYKEEIWDLLEDTRQSFGNKNITEVIAGLNGADDVGSDEQFKNLLAWFAYEETTRNIANELELDL